MNNQLRRRTGRPASPRDGSADSTVDNRERLIIAATTVLAERGYEATTVKAIAEVAGVSPGLFHYYFASKDELLVEVVKAAESRFTPVIQPLRAELPLGERAGAALAATRDRLRWQPEWYRLRFELFAYGLRNEAIRPAVAALLANGRAGIARTLSEAGAGERADGGDLAAVLLACFDGLALQALTDPDFDIDRGFAVLHRLIETLIPASGGEPSST